MGKNNEKEKRDRKLYAKEVQEEKENKGWEYNRNLLETIIDSLVTIGPDGIIIDVNSATEKATGLPREKIIGTCFSEYFTESDKACVGYKQVFDIGKVVDYELYLKHINGSSISVLYNASVYKDNEGQIIGVLAVARDISAIKKYEDELIDFKNNLELIVQQKTAELIIANKELVFQNGEKADRAAELLIANEELVFQNEEKEKRAAELIIANKELVFQNKEKEKRATELIVANKELTLQNDEKDKRAAELVLANRELIFQTGEKADRAAELLIANKELVFQNEEKDKRATELVIANTELVFQNEEKEKQAAELVIANNEIKKSEQTFGKLVELMPEPVLITDSRGVIIDVNQYFVDLYGYSKSDMLGKNPRVLNVGRKIYEELGYEKTYYDSLFKGLWGSIRNIDKGTWTGTVINKDSKGKLMWVELKINSLFDQFGKVIYYIGQPVDVSRYHFKEMTTKIEFYKLIATMSELRDNETGEHMKRVGITARLLANQIGMNQKYCEDIEIFAPMHDIGKIAISDTILLAPRKLTQEEFTIMKQHTIIGNQIISGISELTMAAEIALCHHERWDGTGYPKNIKEEEIPLHARITIIADVYDALRSKRPYKDKWTHEKAVEEILRNKGKMFDPTVVECFLQIEKTIISLYENM